jgi:hypothetical protein
MSNRCRAAFFGRPVTGLAVLNHLFIRTMYLDHVTVPVSEPEKQQHHCHAMHTVPVPSLSLNKALSNRQLAGLNQE